MYHPFWPCGQFSRSNGGKTLFLDENPYFWLRIWKEREISHKKWPVEKWFLWPGKGKKLRSNVWETTRCTVSELSWFFGVNKRLRCSTKVDEMLRCTSPWPSWLTSHLENWPESQDGQGYVHLNLTFVKRLERLFTPKNQDNSEKGHVVVSQTFHLNTSPFQGHKNHFSTDHFWREIWPWKLTTRSKLMVQSNVPLGPGQPLSEPFFRR